MALKRVIPCLDVDAGRVVKGTNFVGLRDAGDPVELAARYDAEGADELVFLDITASHERRETIVELARRTADNVFIPFTIGGGIRSVDDAQAVLDAGADKVSVNSAALARPELIGELAEVFGSQCVVIAIDAKRTRPAAGTSTSTAGATPVEGREAVAWAREATERGAGEVLLTSMDRDGTTDGYDLELTRAVADAVAVPVIASGGAGELRHLSRAIIEGGADAVLCASIFHYGTHTVREAKEHLREAGIAVRRVAGGSLSRPCCPAGCLPVPCLPAPACACLPVGRLGLEGPDRRGAGEVDLLAVGDHRVVLALVVVEDLLAGLDVVAEGADVRARSPRRRRSRRPRSRSRARSRRPDAASAPRRSWRRARRSACPGSRRRRSAGEWGVSATAGDG